MAMAFLGPAERTTDVVARNVSIEALEDPELVIQIQAHRPADFGFRCAGDTLEAVMNSITSKPSRPVRVVIRITVDPCVAAEIRDMEAGQKNLIDLL